MVSGNPLVKNAAQRIVFPILDADGDPTGGCAALDSEYSIDGGNFANCTNEATDITSGGANTGVYYLDLVAAETNGDVICIQVKTSTAGAKTTVLVYYTSAQSLDTVDSNVDAIKAVTDVATPALIADAVWDEVISAGTHDVANSPAIYLRNIYQSIVTRIAQATGGAAGTITLDLAASAVNDFYKGQVIAIVGGAGAGQARACYAYNGGTFEASIRPDWATPPNAGSWYSILNVGSAVVALIEDAVTDQILDEPTEAGMTLRQATNIMLAALAGKSSGGGTPFLKFRDQADTKNRIDETVDADGNRTAVNSDGS